MLAHQNVPCYDLPIIEINQSARNILLFQGPICPDVVTLLEVTKANCQCQLVAVSSN